MSNTRSSYVRNFVFGVEDSLVSTVGLVSGVAVSGMTKQNIILTGIVLVFVEAFSMGVGSLLSENSAKEFDGKREKPLKQEARGSAIMFFSYFLSGFVVILPYLFSKPSVAIWWSVLFSLIGLFVLGLVSAKFSGTSKIRKGLIMSGFGGFAILLGIVVGVFVKNLSS